MKGIRASATILILIAIASFSSCTKDEATHQQPVSACVPGTVSYQNDIKPILATNCGGATCHVAGTGNYDFTVYENVANNIRLGEFEYRLLLPIGDPQHMPQMGPPFPAGSNFADTCDLIKIRAWIRQGFLNN